MEKREASPDLDGGDIIIATNLVNVVASVYSPSIPNGDFCFLFFLQ